MIFHYKPGFLSHRGTLKSSIFCLGFSMKSTLQLLAYVHGLGNLQILSIHNIHLVAALDFTERSTCWALHPGPRPVRSGCWSGMDPEIAENHPLNTPQQLPRWSPCDQKNFIGTIVSSYELNTIHYFGIIPDYTPICICNASGPLVPGLPSLSGANGGPTGFGAQWLSKDGSSTNSELVQDFWKQVNNSCFLHLYKAPLNRFVQPWYQECNGVKGTASKQPVCPHVSTYVWHTSRYSKWCHILFGVCFNSCLCSLTAWFRSLFWDLGRSQLGSQLVANTLGYAHLLSNPHAPSLRL